MPSMGKFRSLCKQVFMRKKPTSKEDEDLPSSSNPIRPRKLRKRVKRDKVPVTSPVVDSSELPKQPASAEEPFPSLEGFAPQRAESNNAGPPSSSGSPMSPLTFQNAMSESSPQQSSSNRSTTLRDSSSGHIVSSSRTSVSNHNSPITTSTGGVHNAEAEHRGSITSSSPGPIQTRTNGKVVTSHFHHQHQRDQFYMRSLGIPYNPTLLQAHVLPPRVEPVNALGIFERSVEGEVEPELSRILDQDQASTEKEIGQPAEAAGEGTQDSLSTNVAKSADEASVISRSEIERQWKAALDSSEQSYEDDIEDLKDAHASEVGEFRETIAKLEAEVHNARKRKGTVQSIAHKTSKKLAAQGNELKTAKNELAAKDDELAYKEGILNAALVESESRDAMLNAALMESKSKDAMLQENATKIRRLEQWSKYQSDVYSELKIEHTEAQEGVVRPLQQEVARLTSLNRGYEDRNSAHISQIAVLQNQLRWVPRLPRLQAQLAQACNERDAEKAESEKMKFELAQKYQELQEEKDAFLEQKLNETAATEENTAATKVVTDQARTLSDIATYLCGSLREAWFEEDQASGQKSAERVQVDNERQKVLVNIQAFLPRMHDNLPPEEGHGTTQAEQDHNDQPTALQDAHENPCPIKEFAKGECLYCNEATSSQCPYCDKTAPGDTADEPGQTFRVDHPKDQSSIEQGKPIETDQVKEVEAVVWQSTEKAYGSANNAVNNLQVALFNASPGAAPNQDTAEVEAEIISPEVLNLQLQHLAATLGLVAVHPAYVEFGHVYEYAQDFAQAQAYADGSDHRRFQETMPAHDDQSEDFDHVDFCQSDDDGSKGENSSHTPPPFEIYEDPIAGDDDGVAPDPPSNGNGGAEAASSRFDFNIFEDPIADTNDEGDTLQRLNFSGGVEDGYDSSASYIPEDSIDDTFEYDYGLQPSPLRPGRQRSGIAFQ